MMMMMIDVHRSPPGCPRPLAVKLAIEVFNLIMGKLVVVTIIKKRRFLDWLLVFFLFIERKRDKRVGNSSSGIVIFLLHS